MKKHNFAYKKAKTYKATVDPVEISNNPMDYIYIGELTLLY